MKYNWIILLAAVCFSTFMGGKKEEEAPYVIERGSVCD